MALAGDNKEQNDEEGRWKRCAPSTAQTACIPKPKQQWCSLHASVSLLDAEFPLRFSVTCCHLLVVVDVELCAV